MSTAVPRAFLASSTWRGTTTDEFGTLVELCADAHGYVWAQSEREIAACQSLGLKEPISAPSTGEVNHLHEHDARRRTLDVTVDEKGGIVIRAPLDTPLGEMLEATRRAHRLAARLAEPGVQARASMCGRAVFELRGLGLSWTEIGELLEMDRPHVVIPGADRWDPATVAVRRSLVEYLQRRGKPERTVRLALGILAGPSAALCREQGKVTDRRKLKRWAAHWRYATDADYDDGDYT